MTNPEVVVGLGNPGSRYAGTYHNLGYMAVDRVLSTWNNEETAAGADHLYRVDSAPVQYAGKPDCYVNQSGNVVGQWLDTLDVAPTSLLVIYDDFSLDLGTVRLRASGRAGGHKGLKSIIDRCGTNDIPRLRLGIGPVPSSEDPADFVLTPIPDSDRKQLHPVLSAVPEILKSIRDDGFERAMSQWNGREFRARR